MTVVPQGVIRVRTRSGCLSSFLVRHIHWSPSLTVLGDDGQEYTLPLRSYRSASPREAEAFWLTLDQAVHAQHTNSRN